jgi:hypothetical protein
VTPFDSPTVHVSLVAHSATGTSTTATLSTGASATIGTPETVTVMSVPQPEAHDQQHRQPLETIEAGSIVPFLFVLGGYMALRRAYRAATGLLGAGPPSRDPAAFSVYALDDDGHGVGLDDPGARF